MGSMIEVHVVQDMPFGSGNRGGDGRPKYAPWAGRRRVRVSSQAWRRAMRSFVLNHLSSNQDGRIGHAWRTRRLPRLVAQSLESKGVDKDQALLLARAAIAAGLHSSNSPISGANQLSAKVLGEDDDDMTAPMLIFPDWGPEAIAQAIQAGLGESTDLVDNAVAWGEAWAAVRAAEEAVRNERAKARAEIKTRNNEEGGEERDGKVGDRDESAPPITSSPRKAQKVDPPVDPEMPSVVMDVIHSVLHDTSALDVWLFGRFLAVLPDSRVDGALQVAHAIGTGVDGEVVDFFVAVDDLARSDEAAAGHVGSDKILAGGTLYRHMVLDVDQLISNMGDLKDEQHAVEFAVGLAIQAFIQSVPHSGATGSAPASVPHVVVVGIGSAPANMVDVFSEPADGLAAAERLCRAWEKKRVGFFSPRVSAAWSGSDVKLPEGVQTCSTPDDLIEVMVGTLFGEHPEGEA